MMKRIADEEHRIPWLPIGLGEISEVSVLPSLKIDESDGTHNTYNTINNNSLSGEPCQNHSIIRALCYPT